MFRVVGLLKAAVPSRSAAMPAFCRSAAIVFGEIRAETLLEGKPGSENTATRGVSAWAVSAEKKSRPTVRPARRREEAKGMMGEFFRETTPKQWCQSVQKYSIVSFWCQHALEDEFLLPNNSIWNH